MYRAADDLTAWDGCRRGGRTEPPARQVRPVGYPIVVRQCAGLPGRGGSLGIEVFDVARGKKDNVFGNVRHPVADPLEVVGREDHPRPALDVFRIRSHETHDLVVGPMEEVVDQVVLSSDLARLIDVHVHQSAKHTLHLPRSQVTHLGQIDVTLEGRMRCQPATLLCDGRRVVADALQLVRYVVQGQQESQIARDRRLGCDATWRWTSLTWRSATITATAASSSCVTRAVSEARI